MDEKTVRVVVALGVIGLVLYFMAKSTKLPAVARPPASAGPGQLSTAAKDVTAFGTLVNTIGGLFKTSSSPAVPSSTTGASLANPDNTQFAGMPIGTQTSEGRVVDVAGDTIAPTDAGVSGPTQSEIDLGITSADWG